MIIVIFRRRTGERIATPDCRTPSLAGGLGGIRAGRAFFDGAGNGHPGAGGRVVAGTMRDGFMCILCRWARSNFELDFPTAHVTDTPVSCRIEFVVFV